LLTYYKSEAQAERNGRKGNEGIGSVTNHFS